MKKYFGKKNFGVKNIFLGQNFVVKNIFLDQVKFLVNLIFLDQKTFLGYKELMVQKILSQPQLNLNTTST